MTEEAWRAARVGVVTASRVADIIAKTKSGPSASRARYMGEIIAERLTGEPMDNGYTNAAMQHGIDTEAEARAAYAFETGRAVEGDGQTFVPHPTLAAGASPDGLVGGDGLLEIKCPQTWTHIETRLGGKVPAKYLTQIQWQMACTGRAWCDFVSYDPRLPDELRLWIRRVDRDDTHIKELESAVSGFLAEVDAKIEQLRKAAA